MTHPHVENDPFDRAMTDEPQYFGGRVSTHVWEAVLEKGVGKVPFDPVMHAGKKSSIVIGFVIEPLDPTRQLIQRDMLNWTSDFKSVVRPSLQLQEDKIAQIRGLQAGQFNPLREINDLWVIGEFVPRPDNKEGETWTTLKFMGVFATEAECQAAYAALVGAAEDAPIANPVPTPDDPQRAAMAAFLPALWNQAGKNHVTFLQLIKDNPMLAAHFNENSPEVTRFLDEPPFYPPTP